MIPCRSAHAHAEVSFRLASLRRQPGALARRALPLLALIARAAGRLQDGAHASTPTRHVDTGERKVPFKVELAITRKSRNAA